MTLVEDIQLKQQRKRSNRANAKTDVSRSDIPEDEIRRMYSSVHTAPSEGSPGNKGAEDNEVLKGYAIIMSITLFTVHCTLSSLALKQYSQDVHFMEIIKGSFSVIPAFFILCYNLHPLNGIKLPIAVLGSCVCGCYLIFIMENGGYLQIIKQTPSLATIWIWLFIELDWYWGVFALISVVVFAKFNGLPLY